MDTATRPITVDEYSAITREGDNTELIDGVMVVDDPGNLHQALQAALLTELVIWTRGGGDRGIAVGPVNVLIDDRNLFGPDLSWFADRGRFDLAAARNTVPDIAVEIRSPSTWRYNLHTKKARYEEQGLPELWLIDPGNRAIYIYRRATPAATGFDVELELSDSETLTSPQLPGFGLPVARLFDL